MSPWSEMLLVNIRMQTKLASPVPASKAGWHLPSHWSTQRGKTPWLLRTVLLDSRLERVPSCGESSRDPNKMSLIINYAFSRHCRSTGGRDAHSNKSHAHSTTCPGGIQWHPQKKSSCCRVQNKLLPSNAAFPLFSGER